MLEFSTNQYIKHPNQGEIRYKQLGLGINGETDKGKRAEKRQKRENGTSSSRNKWERWG